MRTIWLFVITAGASIAAIAAPVPVPENFPQVAVEQATEDACFAAARDRHRPDPASCDVLIQRTGVDAPILAATHNNRGVILAAMNLTEEALGDFDAALALAPNLVQAQINRANMLFLLARYPEALAAYDEVLAGTTADRHVALFNRALVHRALGNVRQAGLDLSAARQLAVQVPGPAKAQPFR